ncbi:MAG: MATE family efflux transporter [Lachnospiraceae bacterium]|nr:MATE family efflux transporter [Lachnospiraceae bacterium]
MKLIGEKDFYKKIMIIAVPIMIQNGITNFVGMLDNIMVGRIGTDAMSGVSIVNQLLFVFFLCLFGATAGIGIFTAQFAGKGDNDGIRYTMRMKLFVSVLLTVIWILVLKLKGDALISLWLRGEGGTGNISETLASARSYLSVILFEMLPFAISMSYAGSLRESGETMLPMKAGVIAVIVNLAGNYVLIYGKFGAPALGVVGAALATILSRCIETFIIVFWSHTHTAKKPFFAGLYRSFFVPPDLAAKIALKASPVLLNEFLWSAGQTVLSQQYSLLGLDVVAGMNIATTLNNVFNIVIIAMGDVIAIVLGQELGKKMKGKKALLEEAFQLALFSIALCLVSGSLLFSVSGRFPMIYNTSDEIRGIAAGLIRMYAVFMPIYSFENSTYFTLRSGGNTWMTFVFDSLFIWVVPIPFLIFMVRFSSLSILPLFAAVQLLGLIKCLIGFIMVKKGIWINDLTQYTSSV